MGFKIEDIVPPEARLLAEEFQCSVCLCMLDEPVWTSCDHIFCSGCIGELQACPLCRTVLVVGEEGKRPLSKHNKPLFRMIQNLKVFCPNRLTSASFSAGDACCSQGSERAAKRPRLIGDACSCNWSGAYADLKAKHLPECEWQVVDCPHSCGVQVLRKDLDGHLPDCANNFVSCRICSASLRPGQMPIHNKDASELHWQLLKGKIPDTQTQMKFANDVVDIVQQQTSSRQAQTDDFDAMFQLGQQVHVMDASIGVAMLNIVQRQTRMARADGEKIRGLFDVVQRQRAGLTSQIKEIKNLLDILPGSANQGL